MIGSYELCLVPDVVAVDENNNVTDSGEMVMVESLSEKLITNDVGAEGRFSIEPYVGMDFVSEKEKQINFSFSSIFY